MADLKLPVDQAVRRLQIAMDDRVRVQELHPAGNVFHHAQLPACRQSLVHALAQLAVQDVGQ